MAAGRLDALRALCAVAEGATVRRRGAEPAAASDPDSAAAAACVVTVLGDDLHRLCVTGGRQDMPRSLGSVLGGSVVRYLFGFRGKLSRAVTTPVVCCTGIGGLAISRDGSSLLVSDRISSSSGIHELRAADGTHLRTIGAHGSGLLHFDQPWQVYIAHDDFAFVAEFYNHRVQVLTPGRDFYGFVGVGQLRFPSGVCADKDSVFVCERDSHRLSVFRRSDGVLLRRFGSLGSGDGQLYAPFGVCLIGTSPEIAVVDNGNNRISVFTVQGAFVRHVGVGDLDYPAAVTCSEGDDGLVVADIGNRRVAMFSACGKLVKTMDCGLVVGVATHGEAVFAQITSPRSCEMNIMFT